MARIVGKIKSVEKKLIIYIYAQEPAETSCFNVWSNVFNVKSCVMCSNTKHFNRFWAFLGNLFRLLYSGKTNDCNYYYWKSAYLIVYLFLNHPINGHIKRN